MYIAIGMHQAIPKMLVSQADKYMLTLSPGGSGKPHAHGQIIDNVIIGTTEIYSYMMLLSLLTCCFRRVECAYT